MENYVLKENETVLYRHEVFVLPISKKRDKTIPESELWLTNLNIVICTPKKKLLRTIFETEVYNVTDVKRCDERVQVINRGKIVDIYLKDKELFLDFKKSREANLFSDVALRLISGESKFVRGVKRVRKEIRETDDALEIDTIGIATTTAAIAADVAIGVASLPSVGKRAKTIGVIADRLLKSKNKTKPQEIPDSNNPEEAQQ